MVPETITIRFLVQSSDADAIFVRRGFFGEYVHGYLGKVEVRADTDCGCNAGLSQNILYHGRCHSLCVATVQVQISRGIDETLIDRI